MNSADFRYFFRVRIHRHQIGAPIIGQQALANMKTLNENCRSSLMVLPVQYWSWLIATVLSLVAGVDCIVPAYWLAPQLWCWLSSFSEFVVISSCCWSSSSFLPQSHWFCCCKARGCFVCSSWFTRTFSLQRLRYQILRLNAAISNHHTGYQRDVWDLATI